ncbi:MAG: pyruvate kinase, partial [Deltaproteobacteria bacterium]|nr:pyruvate kinase [Deltaproteobacteria bacterium]
DGTDAVMLSDETAIGKYPVEAIKVLDRIITDAEKNFDPEAYRSNLRGLDRATVPDAVCYAAMNAAVKVQASAVIVCTMSGHSARLMSKYRPKHPFFAVTTEPSTLNRLALNWGVEPVLIRLDSESVTEDEIYNAMAAVRDQYGLKPGARVVITAGLRTKQSGKTNVMEIREIPRTA